MNQDRRHAVGLVDRELGPVRTGQVAEGVLARTAPADRVQAVAVVVGVGAIAPTVGVVACGVAGANVDAEDLGATPAAALAYSPALKSNTSFSMKYSIVTFFLNSF